MTDDRRTGLVYGHVGEPRYVSELRKWEFARVPCYGRRLKQIGSSKATLPGSSDRQDSSIIHSVASRGKGINSLQASDPFLAPAAAFLPPLAQVSERVNDSAAAFDPFNGDLLAFGKAKHEEPHPGTKFIQIAAIATGPRGENVRFVHLTRDRVRSSISEDAVLNIPTLEGGESSLWIGPGSPIQQLCFSVSAEKSSSLLAARTLLGIVIFRPVVRHTPVPVSSFNGITQRSRSHPASRLDPNPIFTISVQDAAIVPFRDVTFNPWFDEQFAIINERGQWSVSEFDREQNVKNPLFDDAFSHGNSENRDTLQDGWGKMLWVADVNTMVIAHRHSLNVYNIKSRKPIAEPMTQKYNSNDRILDVSRDPRDYSMLYVLTSTKILWMQVQAVSDDFTEYQSTIRVLLSCWHYRSFNDQSLRLSVTKRRQSALIFIWSQLATFITVSTLGYSMDSSSPQILSDTYDLITDLSPRVVSQEHMVRDVGFRTMHLSLIGTASGPVAEFISLESSVETFRLFTLDHGLSVVEGLYQNLAPQERSIQLFGGVPRGQANLKSSTKVGDQFLVPDALCSEDEEFVSRNERRKRFKGRYKEPRPATSEDPFTFSNEWLARSLNHGVTDGRTVAATKVFDSQDLIVKALKRLVEGSDKVHKPGIKLLGDAFEEGRIAVFDLDSTSKLLSELPHQFLQDTAASNFLDDNFPGGIETLSLKGVALDIPSILSVTIQNDRQAKDLTLVSTYNNLVKHWVTSLPPRTPSRTRVHHNRMLRVIALQLYLSLQSIEITPSELEIEPELPVIGNGIEFPALAVRSKTLMTPKSSQTVESLQTAQEIDQSIPPPSFQEISLPTPSPTSAASSQHSMSLDKTVADEAFTRLSALARLEFQPTLRDTGQQLLSHWEVGTDPSAYDWAATKESLDRAGQEIQNGDDLEAQKQKRRRDKRMKRHLESSQRAVASSSQQQSLSLPAARVSTALLGSDPVSRLPFADSSQVTQGMMPHTQEEPGRFGGRPEKKKAAKPARRQGF